jgi:hypothetical protein
MTLRFFKQSATPERVDKSGFLNQTGEISNVIIKETDSTLTPDFILAYNPLVYNSNYIWCEFTSRYYYITDIDVTTGGRLIVHTRVDVLMSFRNEIKASSAWVEVSDSTTDTSDNYDMLHNDIPFRQDYKIKGKSTTSSIFVTPFTHSGLSVVLITK